MIKVLTEEPSRFQIGLCGVDWPRFIKSNTGLRKTSRLSLITAEISTSETQTSSESLVQKIVMEKNLEKKSELVKEYITLSVENGQECLRVLRLTSTRVYTATVSTQPRL